MTPDIPGFLDRRPLVYSYTFLHTYRNVCPHQAAQRYIYKTIPYVETPQMKWGNDVHAAFEHRIGGQKPLPLDMQQWESFAASFDGKNVVTEMKLAIDSKGFPTGFFDKNVWLRGKLDTTLVNGASAYLCDWKTGNSKYEDPLELEVGALLLQAKHPDIKNIRGQYAWLKDNRMSCSYDLSDTRQTWAIITAIAADIDAARKTGSFEKRRGPLCAWCNVWDCENNTNPKKP